MIIGLHPLITLNGKIENKILSKKEAKHRWDSNLINNYGDKMAPLIRRKDKVWS